MRIVREGIGFGESLRWHGGRPWVADWAAGQVLALDGAGGAEVIAEVPSFPLCFDFLPDGRLLLLDSAGRRVLRREPDGALHPHADLAEFGATPWNEIAVDAAGRAYLNNIGFDFPGGEFAPGFLVLVETDGTARRVAGDVAFPNGMALLPGGATLILAESYAERLTAFAVRPDGTLGPATEWAATPGDHPDGICADADGAIWYADVGTARCVRVRAGGERCGTVEFDRGAFSCTLSRGPDPQLYLVGQEWGGESEVPSGVVAAVPAPAPGAGRP
ncbi:SMP-30/gluconolactonase/LRE family protein [Nocardia sp. NPDC050697]|uniref:SMP-30/gluconolactonase/LRE family protein n=1 Tax=Nocardia sp. NPDC050697 TaxID=3155158 RepID=UPI0033D0E411